MENLIKEHLKEFKENFDKELISFLDKQKPKSILKWIKYYIKIGGKRIRPFIAYLMIKYYNEKDLENLKPLLFAFEIYHNSILILDDVQDNDEFRRGKPSLWKIIGKSQAINVGFYGLIKISDIVDSLNIEKEKKETIAKTFGYITKKTVEGQFLDFYLERHWRKLTKKQILRIYLKNNILKTAYYLLLPALAIFRIYNKNKDEEKTLIKDFIYVGLMFQIMNDLEDLQERKSDLKRRLPTLPFILVLNEKNKKIFDSNPEELINLIKIHNLKEKILKLSNKLKRKVRTSIAYQILFLIEEKIKKIKV